MEKMEKFRAWLKKNNISLKEFEDKSGIAEKYFFLWLKPPYTKPTLGETFERFCQTMYEIDPESDILDIFIDYKKGIVKKKEDYDILKPLLLKKK